MDFNTQSHLLKKFLKKIVIAANSEHKEVWWRQYPQLFSLFEKNTISNEIINKINSINEFILYIHIPFCSCHCRYCDFYLYSMKEVNAFGTNNYVKCIIKELEMVSGNKTVNKILSIYIGGGTPNLLKPEDLKLLMEYIYKNFQVAEDAQIAMEIFPINFTRKMAEVIVEEGINRVSLGVQSFNEENLKSVRRPQKNVDVYNTVNYLKKAGHKNINIDLIYGLRLNESVKEFLADNIKHIIKLQFDAINIYPLQGYKMFPKTIYNFPTENVDYIVKKINKLLNKKIVARRCLPLKTKVTNIAFRKSCWLDFLSSNFDRYYYLMGALLKPFFAVGLGGISGFWLDGKFVVKMYRGETLNKYKKDIKSGYIKYDYLSLGKEESLRRLIIHSLWHGINISLVNKYFPESMDLFYRIIGKAEDLLLFSEQHIMLKTDFRNKLPLKTKNELVDYFIMSFIYLYSERGQKELISRAMKN